MGSSFRHGRHFLRPTSLAAAFLASAALGACEGNALEPTANSESVAALTPKAPMKTLSGPVSLDAGWQLVQMPQGMVAHTATALDGNALLIAGGSSGTGGTLAKAFRYDLVTEKWTGLASMHESRSGHTATRLRDGRVLVAGGEQLLGGSGDTWVQPIATAEYFDPITSTWQKAPSMQVAHSYHTASLFPDGRVLVVGGYSDDGFTSETEIFAPNAGTSGAWSEGPSSSTLIARHTATLLPSGTLLIAGGATNWDAASDQAMLLASLDGEWGEVSSMKGRRSEHTATLLPDGRVLFVGGINDDFVPMATVETFDESDHFGVIGTLNSPRYGHTAALLPDGRVLVVGGKGIEGTYSSTFIFDPSVDDWSRGPDLNQPRYAHTMTLLPGGIVVAGGLDVQGAVLDSAEVLLFGNKLGASCEANADCTSGHCVDGICCDTDCAGACMACTAAFKGSGVDGICGAIEKGTDPRDRCNDDGAASCGHSGLCDGKGACAVYEDGTECDDGKVCAAGKCGGNSSAVCLKQTDGTSCGDDDGCFVAICRQEVCTRSQKLDGSRCEGGVCIAGECKLDRTPSPGGPGGGAGGNGGSGTGDGDPTGPSGSGGSSSSASSDSNDEGGGLCSAAKGTPKQMPTAVSLALLTALGLWRRRTKELATRA